MSERRLHELTEKMALAVSAPRNVIPDKGSIENENPQKETTPSTRLYPAIFLQCN
jgi:hypothetical protein